MISYVDGDATYPVGDGQKIIAHVCNTAGAWGAGFVLAISKRWKYPEQEYRASRKTLGSVQLLKVEEDIRVANMIAQNGLHSRINPVPLNYFALRECLKKLKEKALELNATVHMPKIGSGLARGSWEKIEKMIQDELDDVHVVIYNFKR